MNQNIRMEGRNEGWDMWKKDRLRINERKEG